MNNEKKRVALVSVFAAIFLTVTKLLVGILTGSLGLLSEALHSGLDLVAAVITYFSVRVSDKPADREHHYGHGKIENISALIETILLLVTCVWIIYEAIHRLVTKNTDFDVNIWCYVVIIISIIIDITRSRALYRVAKKHNSQALEADALHFSTDIWSSLVVLIGLVCSNFGFFIADSIAALMVAVIVIFVSYKLGKKAINVLIDRAPDDIPMLIEKMLLSRFEVKSYSNLRVRSSGADVFVEVTIVLPKYLTLDETHKICDILEQNIKNVIKRCSVIIHPEPQDLSSNQNNINDF